MQKKKPQYNEIMIPLYHQKISTNEIVISLCKTMENHDFIMFINTKKKPLTTETCVSEEGERGKE